MTTDTGTDARRFNFFMIDNEVVSNYDLNPYEGWLYIAIVRHINQQSGIAFPSLTTLAKECNMSKPTVIKSLQGLKDKKLITITQQKSDKPGEYKPNHYTLVGVVKEIYHPSKGDLPGVVKEVDSNNTKSKKTIEQENTTGAKSAPVPDAPKPKTPHNLMFEAICGVFGYDWNKITKSKRGQVNTATKELIEADAAPKDVTGVYAYCKRKYDHFGPVALSTNWDDHRADKHARINPPPPQPAPFTQAQLDEMAHDNMMPFKMDGDS